MTALEVIPVAVRREVEPGDSLAGLIPKGMVCDGDVLVVSHKAVSKQEGRVVALHSVMPSALSVGIASEYGRDPRLVELVLSESRRIVRMESGTMIVQTHHGMVCANAGVDESNAPEGHAVLLPRDPDASASRLREDVLERTGRRVAVIISDTFGRPFRLGQTDCAIGVSGIDPITHYEGTQDAFGRTLRVSAVAAADELCAAAELVKGKACGTPISIIRNHAYEPGRGAAADLLRPEESDLFR